MHLNELQNKNMVTIMQVVYFYRYKTKINGHKLFLFEKNSAIQAEKHIAYISPLTFS
jgi:hypothetical protein